MGTAEQTSLDHLDLAPHGRRRVRSGSPVAVEDFLVAVRENAEKGGHAVLDALEELAGRANHPVVIDERARCVWVHSFGLELHVYIGAGDDAVAAVSTTAKGYGEELLRLALGRTGGAAS